MASPAVRLGFDKGKCRRVVLFGTGEAARRTVALLSGDDEIVAVCDNDATKHGRYFCGLRISSPAILPGLTFDVVLVASMYFREITEGLVALRVPPERIQRVLPPEKKRELPAAQLGAFNPLVSVVMPAYNRAAVVGRAIRSVLSQVYGHFELVFVDDGSSDDTIRTAEAAAGDDPRLRIIPRPHRGVSATRNAGLHEARGEWIAYLDSDNAWHPEYLARMLRYFATGRYRLGYCASNVFDNDSGLCFVRSLPFDRARLEQRNIIDLNVFMHHVDMFHAYGGFDETMTRLVDWELVLRYTRETTPFFIDAALVDYYIERGLDRISVRESWETNYKIMKERVARARSTPIDVVV